MPRNEFEPLKLIRQLEASGMSREKAEALTWDTNCMVVNCLGEWETRACLSKRIEEIEASITAEMDCRFNRVDQVIARMEISAARVTRLFGVLMVLVAIPALQTILLWIGR
jgi:hypothetical protein